MTSIYVRPLGRLARFGNVVMVPFMYALSGTRESPQRTHFWNNSKLTREDISKLNLSYTIMARGDPSASVRYWWKFPVFHAPIVGGWRNYIVLQSLHIHTPWYVGWIAGDIIGVSRLSFPAVRVLRGKRDTRFFGVTADGTQVPLKHVGCGRIGDGSPYGELPLL